MKINVERLNDSDDGTEAVVAVVDDNGNVIVALSVADGSTGKEIAVIHDPQFTVAVRPKS